MCYSNKLNILKIYLLNEKKSFNIWSYGSRWCNFIIYTFKKLCCTWNFRKNKYSNLLKLNIKKIKLHLLKSKKRSNIVKILNKDFNEIYFLGGQSNVFNSFSAIQETYESQIQPIKIILNFILKQRGKNQIFRCC